MLSNTQKVLYIFIDESGNVDFSRNGTKYYVLTSISTIDPLKGRLGLLSLKYDLLTSGNCMEAFHATEDKQPIRDKVFAQIKSLNDFKIYAIVAQKNKANPSLYKQSIYKNSEFKTVKNEEKFYHLLSENLLKYIFKRYDNKSDIDSIVVILGAIFQSRKREYILKFLKKYLKENFKKPFYIYFHKTSSDINCQLADYCCWSIFIKYEKGEQRAFDCISDKVKSCFDIFRNGTTLFYNK